MKEKIVLKARDGTELAATRYIPDSSNYTTVIIAPGMGRRAKHYSGLANFLCEEGYFVYTFDYRGVGRSRKKAGNHKEATLHQWVSIDLDTIILNAKNQFPGNELVGLAHGISGEAVCLAPACTFFSRLALVDASLSSWSLAGRHGRLRLFWAYVYEAACRWIPGVSLCLNRGIPFGVFSEWLSWSRYPNGLFHRYSNNNYQKLQVPVLSVNFFETPFTTPRAVKALLGQFTNAHHSEWYLSSSGSGRHYPFYHKKWKDTLWRELVLWMQGREPFQQSHSSRKKSIKIHSG